MPDNGLAQLDALALRACSDANYGNDGNWFYSFRRAIEGVYTRRWGADHHFGILTEWIPGLRRRNHEYELSSCLFCMDSAFECWLFALNALGFGVDPSSFASMTKTSGLRRVRPEAIFGAPKAEIVGFAKTYPSVGELWKTHAQDIRLIMDSHDVSKHRSATFSGGQMRMDAPPDFLASVPGLSRTEMLIGGPMSKITLPRNPKLPMSQRPSDLAHWTDLKDLKGCFDAVMTNTVELAVMDVRANVALK